MRLIPISIFLVLSIPTLAQTPRLQLDYLYLDRGEIMFMGDPIFRFPFTNTGDDTLIIASVKSSCGCLVPSYNRQPIAPGATDTIYGKYDTRREGYFSKSMTISSNDPAEPTQIIRITGVVRNQSIPIRFFSTDSLPKNYHRTFYTKHHLKELRAWSENAIHTFSNEIKKSDSIEIHLENSSNDTLLIHLEKLNHLCIVKFLSTYKTVKLLPKESITLRFLVTNREEDAFEQKGETVEFIINDERYTLKFYYPYRFRD
jgi:hypothetical protein